MPLESSHVKYIGQARLSIFTAPLLLWVRTVILTRIYLVVGYALFVHHFSGGWAWWPHV